MRANGDGATIYALQERPRDQGADHGRGGGNGSGNGDGGGGNDGGDGVPPGLFLDALKRMGKMQSSFTLRTAEATSALVIESAENAARRHPERDGRSSAARWRFNRPQSSSTPLAVEVGGVVHLGHYSTRNGMIRVTYGSSCKATQLGGMENAPKALARIILAEQVREALGHNEAED